MSGFSSAWLALREPADASARSTEVTTRVLAALAGRVPVRAVDLGCGTGSNVRYLSSPARLPDALEWRLVDHDPALLAIARDTLPHVVETRVADLRDPGDDVFAGCDLVTASALLDLVSESWLARFVDASRRAGACVLVALNYDGRIDCTPVDHDDAFVRDLVNRHQRTDKGFGPALGPDAGLRAASLLRAAGYDVVMAKSDWLLGAAEAELQRQLIAGWAAAAAELSPPDADRICAWAGRRLAHVTDGTSRLIVGHDDVGGTICVPQPAICNAGIR
jgi:hypothetical protein